jgi:hypothetical protein
MSSSQAKSDLATEDKKQDYMQQLRQELKDFEHAYAKENGGKKPSKDAVKKDVAIGYLPSFFAFNDFYFE